MASIEDDWIQEIIGKFDFCHPDDDHAVAATPRFRRDLKKQTRKDTKVQKGFEEDIKIFYSYELFKKKGLKTKKIGRVRYHASGKKVTLFQTRTQRCGNGDGRIWFVFLDDEPDAPRPVIVLMGCELSQKREAHNKDRINNISERGILERIEIPEITADSSAKIRPDSGRIGEFEPDSDIRPIYKGSYEEILSLFESEIGIRPTKTQLSTILRPEVPIFINGQAGTGKTVLLSIRCALGLHTKYKEQNHWRTLTTCLSKTVLERLIDNTQLVLSKVFRDDDAIGELNISIHRSERNEETWGRLDPERDAIFIPFSSLQYQILSNETQAIFENPKNARLRRVAFSKFSGEFFSRRKTNWPQLTSELAWYGIRSVIKGFAGKNGDRWLGFQNWDEYVSGNTASDFSIVQVKQLFDCFTSYSEWLVKKQYYDDLDLALATLIQIKKLNDIDWQAISQSEAKELSERGENPIELFDEIYLDEAQDLTDIEYRIVLHLLKRNRKKNIILAGDPLQTINPTGFDWAAMSSMMYETLREVGSNKVQDFDPMVLTHNYRTPIGAVRIGNLLLKRRAYYRKEEFVEQTSDRVTDKPELLELKDEEKNSLARLMTQPSKSRFIIGYAVDNYGINELIGQESWLRPFLNDGQCRLESITDVKGLEKDTIILYKFAEEIGSQISKFITSQQDKRGLDGAEQVKILYALNRLYIAITRTKNRVIIIDTRHHLNRFWKSDSADWKPDLFTEIQDTEGWLENEYNKSKDTFNPMEYGKEMLERFKESENTKYLDWAINALEDLDELRRDGEWKSLHGQCRAELYRVQADEADDPDEKKKFKSLEADAWEEMGYQSRAYEARKESREWERAQGTKCAQQEEEDDLLQAIQKKSLSISQAEKLLGRIRKSEKPDWLTEGDWDIINTETANWFVRAERLDDITDTIITINGDTVVHIWESRLVDHFKENQDPGGLNRSIMILEKKIELSDELRAGKRWCIETQISDIQEANLKRIELRKDLSLLLEEPEKRENMTEILLDYFEIAVSNFGSEIFDSNLNRSRKEMIKNPAFDDDIIMRSKLLTLLEFTPINPARYLSSIRNLMGLKKKQGDSIDSRRDSILRFLESESCREYCIEVSKKQFNHVTVDQLNKMSDLRQHAIEIFRNTGELKEQFGDGLAQYKSRDFRNAIISDWIKSAKGSNLIIDALIEALYEGELFKDIEKWKKALKLSDNRMKHERIRKTSKDAKELEKSAIYFEKRKEPGKANEIRGRIPISPEDLLKQLVDASNTMDIMRILFRLIEEDFAGEHGAELGETLTSEGLLKYSYLLTSMDEKIPENIQDSLPIMLLNRYENLRTEKHHLFEYWILLERGLWSLFNHFSSLPIDEIPDAALAALRGLIDGSAEALQNIINHGHEYLQFEDRGIKNVLSDWWNIGEYNSALRFSAFISVLLLLEYKKPSKNQLQETISEFGFEKLPKSKKVAEHRSHLITQARINSQVTSEQFDQLSVPITRIIG